MRSKRVVADSPGGQFEICRKYAIVSKRALSSVGRAIRLHRKGRGFESLRAHMDRNSNEIVLDVLTNKAVLEQLNLRAETEKRLSQPRPEKFIGLPGYSEADIKRELESVERLKSKWEEEETPESKHQRNLASVVEHVVATQFSGEWLANKAKGHHTAEADDVLRGVDVVAEFAQGEERQYLGFAIDVTIAKDASVLEQKLERIWQKDIKTGDQAEVRYLATENYTGPMKLFRVVVGINKESARDLINLYRFDKKEKLSNHAFQAHLIAQIKFQLESYLMYARTTKNKKLEDQVSESLRAFYEIYDAKEEMIKAGITKIESDPGFIRISEFCQTQLKSAERYFS